VSCECKNIADASGTLMLDVAHRRWSSELMAAVGLPESCLPRVLESPEIAAHVSDHGAQSTGLPAGTPVVAGAGDQAAGALGLGIVRPGDVSATIGTSGVVFASTDHPAMDPQGRVHRFCHAAPGRWHVMGVTQAAGLSLRWFRDELAGSLDHDIAYEQLTKEAAATPAGADGLLWGPYLMGERTPHLDPKARGARSPLWRQIQADIYGREVAIVETEEGAAYGAALLAGVGGKIWSTVEEVCQRSVCVRGRIRPELEAAAVMQRQYEAYRALYPALRPIFEKLSDHSKHVSQD
jgi:xylulokinase